MWIPKSVTLIRGWRLFATRRLSEEMWYGTSKKGQWQISVISWYGIGICKIAHMFLKKRSFLRFSLLFKVNMINYFRLSWRKGCCIFDKTVRLSSCNESCPSSNMELIFHFYKRKLLKLWTYIPFPEKEITQTLNLNSVSRKGNYSNFELKFRFQKRKLLKLWT